MMFVAMVVLTLLSSVAAYTSEAMADQVTNLPGAEALNITFNQFSGYIDVSSTKKMHYWFYEAASDPASKPLAFWSNGGPGCSGLLGAMTEQGPFRPNKELNLEMNPYSWNLVANMVFIEAPCGVGFSYSTDSDDYKTGDQQTADDNYALIQGFLARFPEYAENKLYITSESYGGHYMPTLAKKIVDENTAAKNPILNFKGFAVGNPYTNFYTGTPSGMRTYWGHQLVAKPTYEAYEEKCLDVTNKAKKIINMNECDELMLQLMHQVTQKVNPYALDYPVCLADVRAAKGRAQRRFMTSMLYADASPELRAAVGLGEHSHENLGDAEYEPCEDDYTTDYLNRADVKAALHVQSDIKWLECSHTVKYSTRDSSSDMTSYYNYLIDGNYGLDILVYSGDDDSVCSTEGTQSWIWDLGYGVVPRKMWNEWEVDGQLKGYFTEFKGRLGFLTVHGAGHEVPTYQPEAALKLFDSYLKALIGGNWKCNGTVASVRSMIETLNAAGPLSANSEVVIGVPAIHLSYAKANFRSEIAACAEDVAFTTGYGAFTGEMTADMLADSKIQWTLTGHSERRVGFGFPGETSQVVGVKTKNAVDQGLHVMACIGEQLADREAGTTMDVCAEQLSAIKAALETGDWKSVVIAYEPVWAIGTGKVATPEQVQETHAEIRTWLADNVGADVADSTRIVYGGSVSGASCNELYAQPDINGFLVGGASLKPEFVDIINCTA